MLRGRKVSAHTPLQAKATPPCLNCAALVHSVKATCAFQKTNERTCTGVGGYGNPAHLLQVIQHAGAVVAGAPAPRPAHQVAPRVADLAALGRRVEHAAERRRRSRCRRRGGHCRPRWPALDVAPSPHRRGGPSLAPRARAGCAAACTPARRLMCSRSVRQQTCRAASKNPPVALKTLPACLPKHCPGEYTTMCAAVASQPLLLAMLNGTSVGTPAL